MNAEILSTFFNEAAGYLPTIRAGIIAYESDSSRLAELQSSRRQAHSIKGAALALGLNDIGQIAQEIEIDLKPFLASRAPLAEDNVNIFLSKILILENLLGDLRNSLPDAQTPDAEAVISNPPEQTILDAPPAEEDFEIDQEMMEIFGHEAEDLLRNITVNLELLEKSPDNREALLEVRRSSHTLKGSAGIIGFQKLSSLAHRLEDLLDYLAENERAVERPVFELLQSGTDALSALASGENSAELDRKIERIYQDFETALAAFKNHTDQDCLAEDVSPIALPETVESVNQPETKEPEVKDAAIVQEPAVKTDAPGYKIVETIAPNRPVVRVSLERLDEFFKLVGEIVVNRSVFEQRLNELERQIEELHHTTRRLRSSSGKIETDFEAEMLESHASRRASTVLATDFFAPSQQSPVFDALEFDRYTEFHQTTRELTEAASDTSAINVNFDQILDGMRLLFDNQRHLVEGIQNNLLNLRMVSLNTLAPRLQRTVRVTAQEENKLADLIVENDSQEIDTEILDSFVEPLLHLLRNAVAHGIEPPETRRLLGKPEKGTIRLRSYSEGTHIVFVVADDGRGISASKLKEKAAQIGFISQDELAQMSDADAHGLIFLPGLSTAAEINQVSGRGVGMNVVRSSITKRQGTISVKSEPQKGTTFTIRLPMALSTTRTLLVKAGLQIFAFPLKLVKQITEISREDFKLGLKEKRLSVNEKSYPLFCFNDLLNLPSAASSQNPKVPVAILENLETPCVIAFDEILKPEEIVIKRLGAALQNIPFYTGAAILGDGYVVPVLDLVYLLKQEPLPQHAKPLAPVKKSELQILIVDDSPSVRQVNSNLIKNAGWQAITARDGAEAMDVLQTFHEPPDVILTDVEMPKMDGYEFLAALKRQAGLCDVPVIMITSRAGEKHRQKAFDLGADEYLTKPYEESFLLDKIRSLSKKEVRN